MLICGARADESGGQIAKEDMYSHAARSNENKMSYRERERA